MTVVTDLSEFSWIDPDEVHLVKTPANGFEMPLLAKMAAEVDETAEGMVKELVAGLCGEQGCAVCKERLMALSEDAVAKAKLDAKARHALDDSQFAFIDKNGDRKLPVNDASHVRNALARFTQTQFTSPRKKRKAARKILARAKALGIHVSGGDAVAEAAKGTAPDKSVPTGEAQDQTHEVAHDPGTGAPPEAHDGGDPGAIPGADVRPPLATGQGDTSPDKAVPTDDAAHAQTDDAQKTSVDMTGDPAPDGDAAATEARREGEGQTAAMHAAEKARKEAIRIVRRLGFITKAQAKAAAKQGATKDALLGDKAESLVSQLAEVVTSAEREKADGRAHKSARRDITSTQLLKEIQAMPADELTKLLDERDARLVKALRKETKKAAIKSARKNPEAAAKRETKKAAKAAEKAAKAAADPTADLRETVVGLAKTVEAIASWDAKRIVTNPEGLTAALRGPEAQSVFKALEDRVATAEARLEKAVGDGVTRANRELRHARQQLATAKMIAAENARTADPAQLQRRLDGRGVALFTNRHALDDDRDLRFQ